MTDQEIKQLFHWLVAGYLPGIERCLDIIHAEVRAVVELMEEKGLITEEEFDRKVRSVPVCL